MDPTPCISRIVQACETFCQLLIKAELPAMPIYYHPSRMPSTSTLTKSKALHQHVTGMSKSADTLFWSRASLEGAAFSNV